MNAATYANYRTDPDVSYVAYGMPAAPKPWLAEGPHGETGYGFTPDDAIADLHRGKVLALLRKALGADRRPLCNTDKLLREAK